MTKQQREQLKALKAQASSPKSALLGLVSQIEVVSPAQAERLAKIVIRLEAWMRG